MPQDISIHGERIGIDEFDAGAVARTSWRDLEERPRDGSADADVTVLVGEPDPEALVGLEGSRRNHLHAERRDVDELRRIAVDDDVDVADDREPGRAPGASLIQRSLRRVRRRSGDGGRSGPRGSALAAAGMV